MFVDHIKVSLAGTGILWYIKSGFLRKADHVLCMAGLGKGLEHEREKEK